LITPPKSTGGAGDNPLLALGGMQSSADVLARAMMNSATADVLLSEGVDKYTVARDLTTDGPVIIVTTVEKTSTAAVVANRNVVVRLEPTLSNLQQSLSVPRSAQATTSTIDAASKTTRIRKTQERAVIAALAAGTLLTLLSAALLDRLLIGRRGKTGSVAHPKPLGDMPLRDDELVPDDLVHDAAMLKSEPDREPGDGGSLRDRSLARAVWSRVLSQDDG
jgi:hypothetical protein